MLPLLCNTIMYVKNYKLQYQTCSKSFLQMYGADSIDDIIGKTDQELAWDASTVFNLLDYERKAMERNLVMGSKHVYWIKSKRTIWPILIEGITDKIVGVNKKFAGLYGCYQPVYNLHSIYVRKFINQYLNKKLIFTHEGLNIELTKSELEFLFFYLNKTKIMSFKKMSRMINLRLSTVYTYVRNIKEKLRAASLEEVAYMLEHSSFYKRLFA